MNQILANRIFSFPLAQFFASISPDDWRWQMNVGQRLNLQTIIAASWEKSVDKSHLAHFLFYQKIPFNFQSGPRFFAAAARPSFSDYPAKSIRRVTAFRRKQIAQFYLVLPICAVDLEYV
jgi:hypothetical protein